ncbi:MAG: hypothetical protein IVW56_13645 [Candidatus Binataceae bacterium]|nr:hypothetical protein [Candidatus Binataceae bacterium]
MPRLPLTVRHAAAIVAIVAAIAAAAPRAFAHGVIGDYIFLEPIITEDPTPANEFNILQPGWVRSSAANTYSIGFSIEKVIYIDTDDMPRFSVGGGTGWSHVAPFAGPSLAGFDDFTTFAKYAFYYSLDHEFLMSIALQLQLPTGNTPIEKPSHTSLGPVLLWEKSLGDIPNRPIIKYLRPFGMQSDFGYLPALGGHTSHQMFADAVIEYSLPYLSNNVRDIGLKAPLRNMFLFNEINYDQIITGPPGQTFPTLLATPGVAYVNYHFELAVGTQFALNSASRAGNHAAVVALLDIFYDSLFPKVGNWSINRGFGQ